MKIKVVVFLLGFIPLWSVSVILIGCFYKEYRSWANLQYYTPESGDYLIRKLSELDTVSNVDIMVVGSSHAYRGFDPRIWQKHNINLYNLGTSSQSFVQTWQMVEEYLHVLKPKLAIIEVNPFMLRSDGLESTLNFLPKKETTIEGVRTVFLTNHIQAYNTFIYDLYAEFYKRTRFTTKEIRHHKYVDGGFVERDMATNEAMGIHQKSSIKVKCVQEFSLWKTISLLEDNGVQVILIQAPITKEMYGSIVNRKELDHLFSAMGHPYYNFNNHTNFNSQLEFYDSHHLNQVGVLHFQELIFERVNELRPLMDGQGDNI